MLGQEAQVEPQVVSDDPIGVLEEGAEGAPIEAEAVNDVDPTRGRQLHQADPATTRVEAGIPVRAGRFDVQAEDGRAEEVGQRRGQLRWAGDHDDLRDDEAGADDFRSRRSHGWRFSGRRGTAIVRRSRGAFFAFFASFAFGYSHGLHGGGGFARHSHCRETFFASFAFFAVWCQRRLLGAWGFAGHSRCHGAFFASFASFAV